MTVDKWYFFLFFTIIYLNQCAVVNTHALSFADHLKSDLSDTFVIDHQSNSLNSETFDSTHSILKRDTKNVFNISSKVTLLNATQQQLLVHWAGEGSNVIICLARNNMPVLYGRTPVPSAVYISYDYGNSFEDKTEFFKLDNKTYASIDKFYSYKRQKRYTIFMDKYHTVLFTTKDFGKQIVKVKLGFQPVEILSYPEDPLVFLAYDVNKTLWITRDFGQSFSIVQEFVKSYYWADKWPGHWSENGRTLLVQRQEPATTTIISLSNLLTSDQPNITVLFRDASEFNIIGDFMFVSKRLSKTTKISDLYISFKGGQFYKAVFDSELECLNYHIADVSETRLLVAVAHTSILANLYVSEVTSSSQYMFRLSLERLFCYFPRSMWMESWLSSATDESFTDIHKVQGLRGIYLASQVTAAASSSNITPEHLVTLITFDWGAEWKPLTPPKVDETGAPINCSLANNCSLHLSQKFSHFYPMTRSVPILSSPSAPGIIIATGTLGASLKGHAGIFISRDAGLTWHKVLQEYYLFNFGDHGGVITAVKFFKSTGETHELLYSTDEGETWKSHSFFKENIRVYGLMTEPGENTTVFTLFGSETTKHGWLIVNINLRNVFSYNCTKEDYKMWSPSSDTGMKMPCVMGRKETYERRIAHANCYNGEDYDRPIKLETCLCDIEDFECDFGFVRHVSSPECLRNKTAVDPYSIPKTCKPGGFYNRTKGYRKIDGDVCIEGYERNYLPDTIPCPYEEKKQFLLLVQKNRIIMFDLASISLPSFNQSYEVLPVKGLQNIIAVDFDMKNNCVYFADISIDKIGRQCLSSGKDSVEYIVSSEMVSVEGMALDWISNLLYFVDGERAKIEVVRTDLHNSGRMRKTILDQKVLSKPRGIALHPVAGYMYWTDWSPENPSVSRANLDGSDVRRLFTKPDVEWPNGITVDHIAEHIYFVDAKLDYIACADLHGRHMRKILSNQVEVSHPFSVAVFKDNMYWDDWRQTSFFVADKDHGFGIQLIAHGLQGLMDLKVYAHSLQEGTNACGQNNTCSHLCFAQPGKKAPICSCPDEMIYSKGKCLCADGSLPNVDNTCPRRSTTCSENMFSCKNGLCIPFLWKCDGENDCSDNSDEENCEVSTCSLSSFRCGDGKCIPMNWYCDLDKDCDDWSDEAKCTYTVCNKTQFQCKNKRCIFMKWKCDGEDDCKDGSDEEGCVATTPSVPPKCQNGQFKCVDSNHCLPASWRCDGENDCADKSDEENCANNTCETWQFRCEKSHRCIFDAWKCDHDHDCGADDDSDERNCTYPTVTPKPDLHFNVCKSAWMFMCNNKKCIPSWWKCDNVEDCEDGSDELGCPRHPTDSTPIPTTPSTNTCLSNQFRCEEGDCIQLSWVCDGVRDCKKGEDEQHCPALQCTQPDQFKCRFSGSCISLSLLCDGVYNCPDGSDELSCGNNRPTLSPSPASPSCDEGFFPCDGTHCVALALHCNGHQDCYDGFDEANCTNTTERYYQVLQMNVDEFAKNSTSLTLYWYIKFTQMKFEYLPTISEVPIHNSYPTKWINHTEWISLKQFTFTNLHPNTAYNMTVYVKSVEDNKVYHPAKFVSANTSEGLPSPPWNLTVVQKSVTQVEVTWLPPQNPNGVIEEYVVFMTPPLPPMEKSVQYTRRSVILTGSFTPGSKYTFWAVSKNSAGQSNTSQAVFLIGDSEASIEFVKGLKVTDVGETWAALSWDATPKAQGYHILPSINPPYAKLNSTLTTENKANLTYLAPGVEYVFQVNAYNKGFEGLLSSVKAKTKGDELPTVPSFVIEYPKQHGTTVELSWVAPKGSRKYQWEYGIYYSQNQNSLFNGPKLVTKNRSIIVQDLEACESYMFDISIAGPLGLGPLRGIPVVVVTHYNPLAPPKMLSVSNDPRNETAIIISWTSSCPFIEEPIGYVVDVEELVLGKTSSLTFLPSNQTIFKHRVVTDYGARYRIRVQTDNKDAIPCEPVEVSALPLPVPQQVQVVPSTNSSYIVYWWDQVLESKLPKYHFEVLLSEGKTLNESLAEVYNTTQAPFIMETIKDNTIYSLAVRFVSEKGYKSMLSKVATFEGPSGSWTSELTPSRVATVMVPFTLVILLLIVALIVFVVRHRQLQNSFSSFANSYYSTRSGAATFTSNDGLDDEDSPVIRGFSDDEPLVIA